jgi:hypothetical protein
MNSDYFASPPPLENVSFVEDWHLHVSFSMKSIFLKVAATGCLDRGKEESSL